MGRYAIGMIIASVATLGVSATVGRASGPPLPTFRPASGWIVANAGKSNPGLIVAVTAPDVAAIRPVALWGSFKRLSRDGILVWAETVGRTLPGFPRHVTWPPRLATFRIDHGWEGQPAANIQQRTWVGVIHGWDLDVRVFFGTQQPSTWLRALAQSELGRLRMPP